MQQIKRDGWTRAVSLLQLDKLFIVLTAMCVLPLLFHVLPVASAKLLGSIWLPIFYAPLLAVILFRPHVALIAALFSPTINRLIAGMPDPLMASTLTFELLLFVVILQLFCSRTKHSWAMSLIAYSIAKMVSVFLWKVLPELMTVTDAGAYFIKSVSTAIPGLCVLLCIHFLTIHIEEKKRS